MKNKMIKRALCAILSISIIAGGISFGSLAEEENGNLSAIQIVEDGGKEYYLADGGEAGPNNFDVWTSKSIEGTENEDEFEVTLQVGTTVKAVPNDVAVMLVMDVSGSMMNDEDGNRSYDTDVLEEGKKRRIEYTREAAMKFAEEYVKNAGSAERMLSIVQFGNSAQTVLPWTNVNDGGTLAKVAEDSIKNDVRVNFTVEEPKSYWNEEIITQKYGKVDYWNGTEKYKPTDYLVDYFKSFYEIQEATQSCESFQKEADVSICTSTDCSNEIEGHAHCAVEGCDRVDQHMHCSYAGCTKVEEHMHCAVEGCDRVDQHMHCSYAGCNETEEHMHCSYADCTKVEEHMHCAVEGCTEADNHMHCSYEECNESEAHGHCEKCGEATTEEHTHTVKCTLKGCPNPYEGPHTHCCAWSYDACYPYYMRYSYNKHTYSYRCLDSDPSHTHERVDSDIRNVTGSRYFGSVWAISTNMEAGLFLARNLVNNGLEEGGAIEDINNVYVILLSDGKPNSMTNLTDSSELERVLDFGYEDGEWGAIKDIVVTGEEGDIAIAEDIKAVSELYAILYGSELEAKFSGEHPLNGKSGAEWISSREKYCIGADAVFNSPKAEDIGKAFLKVNSHIDLLSKAWVVTDELGGTVDGDDMKFQKFTLNGEHASVISDSEDQNTTISWDLSSMEPEDGTGSMADPFIYTLKYKVTLDSLKNNVKETSMAYEAEIAEDAVWTSNSTNLRYFIIEKEQSETARAKEQDNKIKNAGFANTSVKGIYGDFEFIKKNGETDEPMEGVGFTLYNSENDKYGEEVFSDAEGKVKFSGIPRGEYTLRETTVPTGMSVADELLLKESWGNVSRTNGEPLPDYIINYPVPGVLVINKTLDTYNETIGGATFVFQIDVVTTDATSNTKETVYSDVISMAFDKPETQSVVLKDLPYGAEVTVTEVYSGASYKLTSEKVQTAVIAGENEEKPAIVSFGNTYDGRLNSGNGLVNNFIFDATTGKWIHKVL